MDTEIKEDKKSYRGLKNFRKSLIFYKKYKKLMVGLGATETIGTLIYLLVPIFVAQIIDAIIVSDFETALYSTLYMLAVSIVVQIFYVLSELLVARTSIKVQVDMRHSLAQKAMDLKTSDLEKSSSGFFISRLNTDAGVVATTLSTNIAYLCWAIAQMSFVVYIYYLNAIMGAIITLGVIVLFILSAISRRVYNKNYTIARKKVDKVSSVFNEIIRGVTDIKVLGIKSAMQRRVDRLQQDAAKADLKFENYNTMWFRIMQVVSAIFECAIFGVGIWLAIDGNIAVGALVVVFMYKDNVFYAARTFVDIFKQFTKAEVAAKRLYEIIDGDKGYGYEAFGTYKHESGRGTIEFKNVNFAYGKNQLFKDLTFKIEPNTSVAIVGKSGEGKTTIFNMLTRAYPHSSGQILIDGVPIEDFDEDSLRSLLAGVSQRPYIFDEDFYGNLRLIKPDATEEEMEYACKQAHLHDFIIGLEEGYNTRVGENGIRLSGGQAQRLALARLLLKGSKIMLFDEATSSLDNESQGKVQRALESIQGSHTMLIIAHRLSTIVNCDKIILIDNGKIAAEGAHKQLMKNSAAYRELYAMEDA